MLKKLKIGLKLLARRVLLAASFASKGFPQGRQPSGDGPIMDLGSHFHAQPAQQGRIHVKGQPQAGPVSRRQIGGDALLELRRQRSRAVDHRRAALDLQSHQALEITQDTEVPAGLGIDDLLHHRTNLGLVQHATGATRLKERLGITPGLTVDLHGLR